MACNVCGNDITTCFECGDTLDSREFHCFDEGEGRDPFHFCSQGCWEKWITEDYASSLETAEDDNT